MKAHTEAKQRTSTKQYFAATAAMGNEPMRHYTLISLALALSTSNVLIDGKNRKFDATTTTRLAFDTNSDAIVASPIDGPMKDGHIEIVEAFRLPNDEILVNMQTLPIDAPVELQSRIAAALDLFLTRTCQMATAAVKDQFKTFDCTTYKFWQKKGDWNMRSYGQLGFQFTSQIGKVAIQRDGIAGIVDFANFAKWTRKPTVWGFASLVESNSVATKPGYRLVRGSSRIGIALSNGENYISFDMKLDKLADGKPEMFFYPKIDVDGKIVDGQINQIDRKVDGGPLKISLVDVTPLAAKNDVYTPYLADGALS